MKRYLLFFTLLLCGFVSADNFTKLNGLVGGTWKMKTKNGYQCERWTRINAGELKCVAFKVTGKDTAVLETVSLTNKNGVIAYRVSDTKTLKLSLLN